MPLTIYNTETKTLETFTPRRPPVVRIYTCGPTVYDYAHIGNLRSYVFVDILKRVLLHQNYRVQHTINLTDFGHLSDDGDHGEDKMLKGLQREGLPLNLESMRNLSDRYITAFQEDCQALRILPPTTWSRASDYVREQIRLIKTLDLKGYTYETSDGVYFDIARFPTYGRLGNIDLESIKSGARVEVNPEKRHPADFAVWKKGELGWDSPWGKGFPGWHIECSAMAIATLGKQIDVHTGGIDHVHTHHNAEIAQSEAATGRQFVRYWMHNAFITFDNTKISKSLGNTINLRHLYDRGFSAGDYRYWLLLGHYRSPLNLTFEGLTQAKQALYRLKRHQYEEFAGQPGVVSENHMHRFFSALEQDLDTPAALAVVWSVVREKTMTPGNKFATLVAMDTLLGLGLQDEKQTGLQTLGVISQADIPTEIQDLLQAREVARNSQDWTEADRLRDVLATAGYKVEDTASGQRLLRDDHI